MDYSKKSKEELIKEIEILKKKEEGISMVLDNINEMFYKVSFDGKGNKTIEFVSPQVENVLGITADDYLNNPGLIVEHFHPEEIDKLIEKTKKLKKGQEEWTATYRFYHKKKKKYVWIEENIVTVFDKEGNKKFLFGTAKDVTQKINQQKQLEFILENIDYCIYNVKFDKENKVLSYISDNVKKITGLTAEEFSKEGKSGKLINRIHPDDVDMINKHINEGLYEKKKKKIHTEFRFKPKGKNNYIWIEETVFTSYNKKGEIIETTTVVRDITAKKKTAIQLQESEYLYKTLSSLTNEVVLIHDNGIVKEINDSVYKVLGYKPKELLNKSILKLATKESLKIIKNNIATNYSKPYEVEAFKKNGEKINILITGKPINWKGQKLRAVTLLDITQRKTIENYLKENEEKYRNMFTKNMAGVFITENNKIIECNNSFAKIFGYKSRVQLIGKPATILYFTKKERDDYIKELNKKGTLSNYKIRHKKKDNSELWILTNVSKIGNRIEGTLIEITEEIKREELEKEKLRAQIAEEANISLQKEIEERKKIEKKLTETQKYKNSIISSSIDIICASDKKGNIIEMNNAGLQVFGYSDKEIIAKKVKILYANNKEFLKVSEQLKKTGNYIGEIENIRKNGEKFTSFLSASLLYDQEGNIIGSMGVSRDITELKEAELQLIESEEKYRDLFENATDLIQSIDIEGNIIYVNNAWKKTLEYNDADLKGKKIFDIIHPDCKEKCKILFSEIVHSKANESKKINYELQSKSGKKIIVEGNVSLKYQNGKPHSTRAILRDITKIKWQQTKQNIYNNVAKIITEKVEAEEIYEGIRQELGKVINTNIFSISYLIDNKEILDFTFYYDKTRGGRIYPEKRIKKFGINEYIIHQATPKIIYKDQWNNIIKEGKYKLYGPEAEVFVGVPLKIKNKIIGTVAVQSYDDKNDLDEKTIEILENISTALALTVQRKYDEAKIYDQAARLESIIENSTHLFWTFNKELGLTTFNKNFKNYVKESYGKKAETNLYRKDKKARVSKKNEHLFWDEKYEAAYKGKQQHFITDKLDKRGIRIVKEVFLNPIINDKGEIVEVSGIAHDITEKIIAEEKLKDSLKQKEVLLKEVHHRVKNNLQIISSILNLQSSYVSDEGVINVLKESQNRIKSMSFIHESLYQNNDFSSINFSEYVANLSKNLVHSYDFNSGFINLNLKIKEVTLDLDSSIPCGLILNELVTNALKYAFKDRKKGIITIELFTKNDKVILIVKDNGIGLPKEINVSDTDTLGLQLVMTLVDQIDGKIKIDTTKGTTFTLTFKKKN